MPEPRYVQGNGPTSKEQHKQCILPSAEGVREGAYTQCLVCGDYFGFLHDEGFLVWRRISPIWNPIHHYRAAHALNGAR